MLPPRRLTSLVAFIILLGLVPAAAAPAALASITDPGPPVLVDFTLTPASVDVSTGPANVDVTLSITNGPAGPSMDTCC